MPRTAALAGVALAFSTVYALRIPQIDERVAHPIVPLPHWLRDSALAVTMAVVTLLLVTALARVWIRAAGLQGVSLSLTGLPSGTASFKPTTVVAPGSSSLTVRSSRTPRGTFPLTVRTVRLDLSPDHHDPGREGASREGIRM